MKVCLISISDPIRDIGGKSTHLIFLEEGIRRLGHELTTYYPVSAKKLPRYRMILNGITSIIESPPILFSRSFHEILYKAALGYYKRFFSKLDCSSFDIIHAHDIISASYVNTGKLVLTLHGYFAREILNYNKSWSDGVRRRIYAHALLLEKDAVQKAKHVIVVDSRIKDFVIKELGYPSENVTVMYNAVNTDKFVPVNKDDKEKLRAKLGLPLNKIIVLVPRRYVDKNGVHYAARAFRRLGDENFFFIFAGTGPLGNLIKDILKDKKNVVVTDGVPTEQMPQYYQASDIVLIPSITTEEGVEEATSISMLEGMACGKIVVCTNVGGMKEVIKDGENGFLIEQKSEEAIVEKLLFIKDNLDVLEDVRRCARTYVVQNHSHVEHAKKVLEVYSKVLKT